MKESDGLNCITWHGTSVWSGCSANASLQDYKSVEGIKAAANHNTVELTWAGEAGGVRDVPMRHNKLSIRREAELS